MTVLTRCGHGMPPQPDRPDHQTMAIAADLGRIKFLLVFLVKFNPISSDYVMFVTAGLTSRPGAWALLLFCPEVELVGAFWASVCVGVKRQIYRDRP
ncbi:hypothetical protein E2C06_35690 [Dankookia rubra]|uniref:Uncharacterized protein n=1 Tax=Dankookia rubra TaxID=1442381 RepID=A0A4R5Q4I7_9PROT|nr:hypothetical protein [Dankookia rubra]TDH57860.1 hypothetical protein E2C06_35690 [Dankookia rubra]